MSAATSWYAMMMDTLEMDSLTEPEICYSILHIERHNRSLQDPWSLRQTGVYHQFSGEMATSRWIFLNLGESLQRFPQDFLVAKIANEHCQLGLHVRLLNILGSNWIEYIEYLELELRKLVRTTIFLNIETCLTDLER